MTAQVSFNPTLTTTGLGSFNVQSDGFVQGVAMDAPAIRNSLAGGILAPSETLPMWGGVAICENIPNPSNTAPDSSLGGYVGRATNVTANTVGNITGFSVFDQNHSAINTPQSPVPLVPSGSSMNFYRLGSGARIAVACDSGLIATLRGGIIDPLVSWDFTSQQLVPYSAAFVANPITGATWASTAGGQINYTVTNDLTGTLAPGDTIDVSGVVSTGATTNGYNGTYDIVSITSTHIVVTAPRAASPGTYASGGQVNPGGGPLPVKVLDFNAGNSMTVVYDPTTGFATWNRSGNTALILI